MFLELFPAGMCCPAVSSAGGCSWGSVLQGSLSSHWVFWVSPLPAPEERGCFTAILLLTTCRT